MLGDLQAARREAVAVANADDASVWRWFSALMEDRRIRWIQTDSNWLVTVDHRHVATSDNFDKAIRMAKKKVSLTL